VNFIPPQFAKEVLDHGGRDPYSDEWTKKKFDEGKSNRAKSMGPE